MIIAIVCFGSWFLTFVWNLRAKKKGNEVVFNKAINDRDEEIKELKRMLFEKNKDDIQVMNVFNCLIKKGLHIDKDVSINDVDLYVEVSPAIMDFIGLCIKDLMIQKAWAKISYLPTRKQVKVSIRKNDKELDRATAKKLNQRYPEFEFRTNKTHHVFIINKKD